MWAGPHVISNMCALTLVSWLTSFGHGGISHLCHRGRLFAWAVTLRHSKCCKIPLWPTWKQSAFTCRGEELRLCDQPAVASGWRAWPCQLRWWLHVSILPNLSDTGYWVTACRDASQEIVTPESSYTSVGSRTLSLERETSWINNTFLFYKIAFLPQGVECLSGCKPEKLWPLTKPWKPGRKQDKISCCTPEISSSSTGISPPTAAVSVGS